MSKIFSVKNTTIVICSILLIAASKNAQSQEKIVYKPGKSISNALFATGSDTKIRIDTLDLGQSSETMRAIVGIPLGTAQRGEGVKEDYWYQWENDRINIVYASDKAVQIKTTLPEQVNITIAQIYKKFPISRVAVYKMPNNESGERLFYFECQKLGVSFVVDNYGPFGKWTEADAVIVHVPGKRAMPDKGYVPINYTFKKGQWEAVQ